MANASWNIAENWQRQRALIATLYHQRGVTLGVPLVRLLNNHANPGPGYGHQPAEFGRERAGRPLPTSAGESKEERQRRDECERKYVEARDRLVQRFRLVPDRRQVSREEMADIRRELAAVGL